MKRRPVYFVCAIATLTAVSALAANAQGPWVEKDWHQWTEKDCHQILTASPWAKTVTLPCDSGCDAVSYTFQIISALPIRQAQTRQRQIENHYDEMSPEQREAADARTKAESGKRSDDRIDARVIIEVKMAGRPTEKEISKYLPSHPLLILPTGKRLKPRHWTRSHLSSPEQTVFELTFQQGAPGKPLIEKPLKKLRIELLAPALGPGISVGMQFPLEDMIYAGKLEY